MCTIRQRLSKWSQAFSGFLSIDTFKVMTKVKLNVAAIIDFNPTFEYAPYHLAPFCSRFELLLFVAYLQQIAQMVAKTFAMRLAFLNQLCFTKATVHELGTATQNVAPHAAL